MDYMKEFVELDYQQSKTFIKDSKNWIVRDFIANKINSFGGTVLDVGCGNGNDCNRYDKDLYIGVDISNNLLKVAQEENSMYKFVLADASKLPFEDCSFDNVFCISLLEHLHSLQDAKDVLREILRVTKYRTFVSWHKIPGLHETTIRNWKDQTGRHFGFMVYSNLYNIKDLTTDIIEVSRIETFDVAQSLQVWQINKNV